ncbi:unnamed protein product [Gongylonema pulchrum]|uniref:Thiolase_C domain-containing protein n=1 Tax=Gongylonema pulchrum TaxID=637853 RepID=A0A183D1A2_9BILA|nr:unnamed protein product [Gongylonema pulchrum]
MQVLKGICDGAAAVIVADENSVLKHSLKPLARVIAWSVVGCDPTVMGIGPVPAIKRLLKLTGMELSKIDLVEVNEAFAAQTVSVQRELKLRDERLNVNGGAIAIGHPLAASGSRIICHLCYEMQLVVAFHHFSKNTIFIDSSYQQPLIRSGNGFLPCWKSFTFTDCETL